jgi:hypothetical protein
MISTPVSAPPKPIQQLRQSVRGKEALSRRAIDTARVSASRAGLALDWKSNPILGSDSDSDMGRYSDPDTDSYSDPDTDSYPDPDTIFDGQSRTEIQLKVSANVESGNEREFEANKILNDIARFKKEGPTKPKQTSRTKTLWKTESQFWAK